MKFLRWLFGLAGDTQPPYDAGSEQVAEPEDDAESEDDEAKSPPVRSALDEAAIELKMRAIKARAPVPFPADALTVGILYEHRVTDVALTLDGLLTEAGVRVETDYRHHRSEYAEMGWVPFMDSVIGSCNACILLRTEEGVRSGNRTTDGLREEWAFAQLLQVPIYDTLADGWQTMTEEERRESVDDHFMQWLRENARPAIQHRREPDDS